MKLLSNSLEMLTNSLYLWKTASVDTSHLSTGVALDVICN